MRERLSDYLRRRVQYCWRSGNVSASSIRTMEAGNWARDELKTLVWAQQSLYLIRVIAMSPRLRPGARPASTLIGRRIANAHYSNCPARKSLACREKATQAGTSRHRLVRLLRHWIAWGGLLLTRATASRLPTHMTQRCEGGFVCGRQRVEVLFRGGDAAVPKSLFHDLEVGAASEKPRGMGVAEVM